MTPVLFNTVSSCCEGVILLTFESMSAVPSWQRLSVLLTSRMAGICNTDEYVGFKHLRIVVKHCQYRGQQVI